MGGAALVDKDTLEWPLANAALVAGGEAADAHDCELYTKTLKAAAYETCLRIAEQNCRCGVDVVLVAPFTSQCARAEWVEELERRFGADVALAWVTADPERLRARKVARGSARDAVDLASQTGVLAAGEATRSSERVREAELQQVEIVGYHVGSRVMVPRSSGELCVASGSLDPVVALDPPTSGERLADRR